MNNGVYALPGFMAPAAKNWKSQLLTNEDGSVKLCVYVGKPGTKVYYSLGIPGWRWGFIKDAQYFIDKGYPQEVIDEVSKFADYLEEEVTELPEGTVIPDIIINGWPLPITESPIEGKVYWILNIPKFVLPAGDTEVQISANGKLIKYTITRPDFSIHHNTPGYTTSVGTPGGGSSAGGLTSEERALLNGAAQRDSANTFTAANTFTGSVDMSTAQVTPPEGWNVGELTPEAIKQVVPIDWGGDGVNPLAATTKGGNNIAIGTTSHAQYNGTSVGARAYSDYCSVALGTASRAVSNAIAIGYDSEGANNSYGGNIAIGSGAKAKFGYCISIGGGTISSKQQVVTIGSKFNETVDGTTVTHTCTTQGTGSITIGAGANTLNNGDTESSNSVTIGCKASNTGADSVVIGAQAKGRQKSDIVIGVKAYSGGNVGESIIIGLEAGTDDPTGRAIAIGRRAKSKQFSVAVGDYAKANSTSSTAIGDTAIASANKTTAIGFKATAADYGATVIRSTAEDGTYTQLYFSGANTPLANTYTNGEALMGFVTSDKDGNPVASGYKRLSAIFDEGSMTQPATLDEFGEWVQPKVFHPSDLDMPQEEPTEPEEYQPLPVYPIVEPEVPWIVE